MRRVKSAPGNLAKMSHNKKEIKKTPSIFMSSVNVPIIVEENNDNSYKLIKSLKENIKIMGNLLKDTVVEINYDKYSLEEITIFSFIVGYFSNNILKKNKLKEIQNFLAKSFVRYLIMLFIHTHILHDKIDNSILNAISLPIHI
tara:strand:- start:14979 stop:15410 length:432 start_codon:yes stop_codon:yes gene_type:complete